MSEELLRRRVCVDEVSKDVAGDVRLLEQREEECRDEDCRTLKTVHMLILDAVPSGEGCDSDRGSSLNGSLYVKDLVHVFADGDSTRRGVHAGSFRWNGAGTVATGSLSGITNAGTHRRDPFDECQHCHDPGWMEGRLCGSFEEPLEWRLAGCRLIATYRLRLDGSFAERGAAIRGTVEGVIMCACDRRQCVDFQGLATGFGPNPRVEQGITFTLFDTSGAPAPQTAVSETLGFTGFDCSPTTEIVLPLPASMVELLVVHAATGPTVQAFAGASLVASVPVTVGPWQPQALPISGPAIDRIVIPAFNTRAKLLRLCFEPAG